MRSLGIAETARSEPVQVKKGGEIPKEVSKYIRLVGGRSRFQTCKGRGSSKPAVTHRWGGIAVTRSPDFDEGSLSLR